MGKKKVQDMPKTSAMDAKILLEVMSIYLSPAMLDARRFWRTLPDDLGFEELLQKYPKGSEDYERLSNVMIFWETVGSLLKRGLNRDLAFDTFLDAPPWPKVKRFFEERRKKEDAPLEGENIERAYELSMLWKKSREKPGKRN